MFLDEVANVNTQLASLEVLHGRLGAAPFLTQRTAWEACTRACHTAADELAEVVMKLRRHIEKRGIIGSVQAVLKQETIKDLRYNLGQAKLSVVMAQQSVSR